MSSSSVGVTFLTPTTRKTGETLESEVPRRKSVSEKNAQRDDIDEAIGEGGGDEEEDGESEDDNEDAHGTAGVAKRPCLCPICT